MKRTLVLDRKNIRLNYESNRLIISGAKIKSQSIPLSGLAYILILANIQIESRVLNRLAEQSIPVTFINPRSDNKLAILYGKPHKHCERRFKQYQIIAQTEQSNQIAVELLKYKLIGHLNTLRRLKNARPEHQHCLMDAFNKIQNQYQRITTRSFELDYTRGIEGACAAIYFKAFCQVFAPSLNFNKRQKRPPPDPVNALLSLSYTLLTSECNHALYGAGFDPMLGVLHEPSYGRHSLACDMCELFRARIDYWVYTLLNQQVVRDYHFKIDNGQKSCLLKKEGRQIYFAKWQGFVKPLRRLIRQTAYQWNREYLHL